MDCSRLRSRTVGILGVGAAILFLALVLRLLLAAWLSEAGFPTLRRPWRDATLGWIVGPYRPVPARTPDQQAAFWQREVDRVLHARPNDAATVMGAALILDSAAIGNDRNAYFLPPWSAGPVWASETLRAEDSFEKQCQERCLTLAEQATRLAPEEPAWWRLRALLLYRRSFQSQETPLRSPEGLAILEECARHDPDNALYDYLAALATWGAAADWESTADSGRPGIDDAELFQQGIDYFRRGLAKRYLAGGEAAYSVVADFLAHTSLARTEYPRILDSRALRGRYAMLVHGLWRWQSWRAEAQSEAGEISAAIELHRETLRLLDQAAATDDATVPQPLLAADRVATARALVSLAKENRVPVGEVEWRRCADLLAAARREWAAVEQASVEQAVSRSPSVSGAIPSMGSRAWVQFLWVKLAPPVLVVLLLLSLVTTFGSGSARKTELFQVGLVGQLATLALAVLITAIVFGLAPAGGISKRVQAWIFTASLLGIPLVFVAGLIYRLRKTGRLQFSILSMMLFTLVVGEVLGVGKILVSDPEDLFTLPYPFWVPTRSLVEIDPELLGEMPLNVQGTGSSATLQWLVYSGPYLTLFLWVALLIAVYRRCLRRASLPAPRTARLWLAGLCRSLRGPLWGMFAILLALDLLLMPGYLEWAEHEYQQGMAFARDPKRQQSAFDEALQRARVEARGQDGRDAGGGAEAIQKMQQWVEPPTPAESGNR